MTKVNFMAPSFDFSLRTCLEFTVGLSHKQQTWFQLTRLHNVKDHMQAYMRIDLRDLLVTEAFLKSMKPSTEASMSAMEV